MKNSDDIDAAERRVLNECMREAFWYRSLPLATLAGAATLAAVRKGRLKANTRFGAAPKAVAAVSLGILLGQGTYITGRHCQDKFVEQVPDGEIAEGVRRQREEEAAAAEEEEGPHDLVIPTEERGDVLVRLNDREEDILEDCRRASVLYYSLPLSFIAGYAFYHAQAKKYLSESRWLRPSLAKAPKVATACAVGYFLGQLWYYSSSDCADRFVDGAPRGEMAQVIRQVREGKFRNVEKSQEKREVPVVEETFDPQTTDEYIIPISTGVIDSRTCTIQDLLDNS